MSAGDKCFPTIGGHAAVAFVNTRPVRGGERVELLNRFDDLARWAGQMGLIGGAEAEAMGKHAPSETRSALDRALRLRELLEREFASPPDDPPSPRLLAAINEAVAARRGVLTFGRKDGSLRGTFEAPLDRPADLVAAIAQSVAEFYASEAPQRLKQCPGTDCVLWFVDTSRNRSRHWCRMDRCGARAKAGAYYDRKRKGIGARSWSETVADAKARSPEQVKGGPPRLR